jgi:hypothetical protein
MERLVADSDVMIADITNWGPNVLHQIGLRHALRRRTTILMGASWEQIPYDLSQLTRIPYALAGEKPTPDERKPLAQTIAVILEQRPTSLMTDSPIHDSRVLASGASYSEFLALPPQHLRYETKLGQFRREADFEKSVFIMTKFPEGKSAEARQLSAIIATVQRTIRSAGFVPRIACDRMYYEDVWSNVELYLLGCRYGVAIVEATYRPELNPNVAMEWGWMWGLAKTCCSWSRDLRRNTCAQTGPASSARNFLGRLQRREFRRTCAHGSSRERSLCNGRQSPV